MMHMPVNKSSYFLAIGSFTGMLLGIVLGMLARTEVIKVSFAIPFAEVFAKTWIVVLIILAIPLVATFLLTSLLQLLKIKLAGKLVFRGFGIHLVMLVLGAMVSVALGLALIHWMIPVTTQWSMVSSHPHSWDYLTRSLSFIQSFLARLIVPIVLFTVFITLIVHRFPEHLKTTILNYANGISKKLFNILHYVFLLLPFSAASLALVISFNNGVLLVGIAGFYVLGVCSVLLTFIGVQYGAVYFFGHTTVKNFAKTMLPAQLVAASTCSSLATLPALLVSTKRSGIADDVSGSTVPLFVSFFRVNLMVANPFSYLMLLQLYDLPFEWTSLLVFLGMMMITSFGSPGLPQTGNVYSMPVFLAAGIPLEGIVLLKALDAIPDIFKTVLNVTETAAVTSIVAQETKENTSIMPTSIKPQPL
jgi:Na+/H+-dicarboxylate symporter